VDDDELILLDILFDQFRRTPVEIRGVGDTIVVQPVEVLHHLERSLRRHESFKGVAAAALEGEEAVRRLNVGDASRKRQALRKSFHASAPILCRGTSCGSEL
jgi:hypothetical protein